VGSLIAFALITETVFQWPGMGMLFIQAVTFLDIPVMAAYLCIIFHLRCPQHVRRYRLCGHRSASAHRALTEGSQFHDRPFANGKTRPSVTFQPHAR
jgi:hypothetical protein